jgi:hypothetical protein
MWVAPTDTKFIALDNPTVEQAHEFARIEHTYRTLVGMNASILRQIALMHKAWDSTPEIK